MTERARNYEEELVRTMDAVAESIWEMSDEEVLKEAIENGEDLEKTAERIRLLFCKTYKEHIQRPLYEAQQQYETNIADMARKNEELPNTPAGRRTLLEAFMASHPQMGADLLTAQHRNFSELTDADIKSCLEQLQELGALDEVLPSKDKE